VAVEFATSNSRHLNTDLGTKQLEMHKVWVDPKIRLKQGLLHGGVNEAVVQIQSGAGQTTSTWLVGRSRREESEYEP
jgi:hypothetical protein